MVTVVTIKMTAGAVSKIPSQPSQPSREGKNRVKSVQIPYDLFVDLVLYHLNGEDDFDEEIRQGLEQKLDAMLNRQLYSQSKFSEEQEQIIPKQNSLSCEFLQRVGITIGFLKPQN